MKIYTVPFAIMMLLAAICANAGTNKNLYINLSAAQSVTGTVWYIVE